MPYKDPQKEHERSLRYYAEHREKIKERARKWRAENLERAKERCRRYYYNHRDEILAYQRKRRKHYAFLQRKRIEELKSKYIKEKGGKCEICGYNDCIAALCFHHLNRESKEKEHESQLNDFDLSKVQLLCLNCHAEIHYRASQK